MKFVRIVFGTLVGILYCVNMGLTQPESAENGIRQAFYNSGVLLSEETIMDGKREGSFNTFYENGALQSRGQYRNDKEECIFQKYYQNGALMLEVEYKEGRMDGMIRFYAKTGKLIRQWKSNNYKPGNVKGFFDPDRPFDVSKLAKKHKFYALTVSPRDLMLDDQKKKD